MTRAHVIALGVLGLTLAECIASAPAVPAPKVRAYGPRSYVISVGGVRMRKPRRMPAGDTRTKAPVAGRERAVRAAWDPMEARAALWELEAQ